MFKWIVLGVAGVCFMLVSQASVSQAQGWWRRSSCPNCQYSAPTVKVPAKAVAPATKDAAQVSAKAGKAGEEAGVDESPSDLPANSQGSTPNYSTYRRTSWLGFGLFRRFRR